MNSAPEDLCHPKAISVMTGGVTDAALARPPPERALDTYNERDTV